MKKSLLLFSTVGAILLYILFHTRDLGLCDINCPNWIDQYQNVFLFFPILLLFSLLTLKMNNAVFIRWWKFARIAIPIVLIISTLINMGWHHTVGGFMNLSNIFDVPALVLMYAIFSVGSLIQIWRGYKMK